MPALRPSVRYIAGVVLIALAYFLGAQLGAYMAFVNRAVTPVWPPSGIALALLLLMGVRYWPGVALGILVETVVGSASPTSIAFITVGNTAVAVGSAALLRRFTLGRSPLDRPEDALRLIIIGLTGPVIAAAIGVVALRLTGSIQVEGMLSVWRVWWLGDVVGVLLVAPAILAWAQPAGTPPWRATSFWVMLAALVGLSLLVFREYIADARVEYPLAYAIIPLVLWMTLRHGHRAGTLATVLVAGIAIFATVRGHGALARDEMQESLLLVATFCSVMAVTAMLVGASVGERRRTEEMLRQVIEGTSRVMGEAFFRSLVSHLAPALGARWAFVAVVTPDAPDRARTLALWADGALAEPLEYPLAGSPCALAMGLHASDERPGLCHIRCGVAERYPEDRLLRQMGVESYLGAPLLDRRGTPIGILVVMHDRPLPTAEIADSIHAIFASRAAAELERLRDEADRRRLDEQFRQTQKLESLGVLAGGIAHDFNNLLAGILGNASLAKADLIDGTVGAARESVAQIETAARRAADLTRQMLAYSGRGAFVIQRIDLSALVAEMAHLLTSVVSKKAELRLETPVGLPACEGDATQLRQVVMNLITNASDALGDEPGTITITTGVVSASRAELERTHLGEHLPEGRYLMLEVRDTGCGMDAATRARIFDPFFTTKFTGRGLGLAATLGIVRGHRGAIAVESDPGRGSRFRLYLPVQEDAAPVAAPAHPEPGVVVWRGTGRVMVVDDEELVRTLAARVLEASGFEVVRAADGREAIDLFARQPDDIRLVLLDWMMPNLNGAETLDALRRLRSDVPVILSSGYAEQTVSSRLDDRLTTFIQKPYRPQELIAKVKAALAGQPAPAPRVSVGS